MIAWDEDIVDDIARRRAVLFLGAGVSKNAANEGGRRPKDWNEFLAAAALLITDVSRKAEIDACLGASDLLTACELIRKHLQQDRFTTLLRNEYSTPAFQAGGVHDDIVSLDARFVVTTNFDKVYEVRANHINHNTVVVKHYYDEDAADVLRRRDRCVLKIHGSIDSPARTVFTRSEYANARNNFARFYDIVDALLHTHTFIFLGASMRDPDIQLLLENHAYRFGSARPHYMVMPEGSVSAGVLRVMEDSMRLRAIPYDPQNNHKVLADSLHGLVDQVNLKREELTQTEDWLVDRHAGHSTVAPPEWELPSAHTESKLHQLSPYIGKLKSGIAGTLIERYSSPGDRVFDPFCGSGTIPLECVLRGRRPLGCDVSSYAVLLTKAKLSPPDSLESGLARLQRAWVASQRRGRVDLRRVPIWVRKFFHPETLSESILFVDECLERNDAFLVACLLGILHHQRPGFLSYPSSHLVPYLRDKLFPRSDHLEMYDYRAVLPRMQAKLRRALRDAPEFDAEKLGSAIRKVSVANYGHRLRFQAIVTSPPYMNALDYARDNRLRLWFLNRAECDYSPEPTDRRSAYQAMMRALVRQHVPYLDTGGYCVLVVGETVRRKRVTSHPADYLLSLVRDECSALRLVDVIEDAIPDVRRSRRASRATKMELVLAFRKER